MVRVEGFFDLSGVSQVMMFACYAHKSRNKGLISVDRRAEPTLILTIPCSVIKSSTNDLSLEIFEIRKNRMILGET